MKKLLLGAIAVFSMLSMNAQEQEEKKLISGNSFNYLVPQGNLAKTYTHGYGVYANFDYNFSKFLIGRFDLGWNDLSGDETSYIDTLGVVHTNHPSVSLWEFSAGLRAQVSVFYIEARGGYFSGVKEWGVVPAVGLRFGKLDIQGYATITETNSWAGARIGYYWGK